MAEMPLGLHLLLSVSALFARPCAKAQARTPFAAVQARQSAGSQIPAGGRREGWRPRVLRCILNFFFIIELFPPLSIKLYDNH